MLKNAYLQRVYDQVLARERAHILRVLHHQDHLA